MFQFEIREQRLRFADTSPSSSYSHKEVRFMKKNQFDYVAELTNLKISGVLSFSH